MKAAIRPVPVLCLTLRVLIYKVVILGLQHALLIILLLHDVAETWIIIRVLRRQIAGLRSTPYAAIAVRAVKLTFVVRLLPLKFLNAVVDLLQLLLFLGHVTLASIFHAILAELIEMLTLLLSGGATHRLRR